MNILFVVPYVPNQIRVRPYNLIRHLAKLDHRITLFTIWTSADERKSLQELEGYCDRVIAVKLPAWRSFTNCLSALPTDLPLQAVYSWDSALAEEIYKFASGYNGANNYDIIHVEHLRGARYGVDLIARLSGRRFPLPVVWDSVDSISLLFSQAMVRSQSLLRRGLTRFELGRTARYEGWLVNLFDHVLVTSENDKKALLELSIEDSKEPAIDVLANGVDLGYFNPGEVGARDNNSIVLSGKMGYHANITMVTGFVQDVMPYVWENLPAIEVWIVGKDPPSSVQALGKNPKVHVTGTVEDIRPYLHKATLAASPIKYGAGIQNKVLEAMACATPVIASPQAVSALSVEAGVEILVADDPRSFAEEVIALFEVPERRKEIGLAGRRFVERNHNWAVIANNLEDIYSKTIQRNYVN